MLKIYEEIVCLFLCMARSASGHTVYNNTPVMKVLAVQFLINAKH